MKMFSSRRTALEGVRGSVLAVALFAALALTLLPHPIKQCLCDAARTLLQPGQRIVAHVLEGLTTAAARAEGFCAGRLKGERALREAKALRRQNQQLKEALLLASHAASRNSPKPNEAELLLNGKLLAANVLGTQSRVFLERHGVIDVGRPSGVEQDALVLAPGQTLLDQGSAGSIAADQLVLTGATVLGKIDAAGRWTSTVRMVSDKHYRDAVQLASRSQDTLRFGARGLLEGTGQRLCRVRMVPATEKVAVGDLVYTAPDPLLPIPLIYGRVVRAQRPSGATDWEIWMEPATDQRDVRLVHVLAPQMNSARMASNQSTLSETR